MKRVATKATPLISQGACFTTRPPHPAEHAATALALLLQPTQQCHPCLPVVYLPVYLSARLSARLLICLSIYLSARLLICLSTYLPVYLSACLLIEFICPCLQSIRRWDWARSWAQRARRCAKRHFSSTFDIKMIILPRQARDRHRESTQKSAVLCRRQWAGCPRITLRGHWTDRLLTSVSAFRLTIWSLNKPFCCARARVCVCAGWCEV
jgi:hypothetical protein